MTLFRITQPHPYLTSIRFWYESSFPPEERRNFDDLLALLPCPDMHLCALVSQQQPVGFIIYWLWADVGVLFIEHFAIDPQQRNTGLGQQALTQVLTITATHYLLEAELPTDPIRQRRIRFYERQGFQVNDYPYAQPPYQPGSPAIPMKLLSLPGLSSQEEFDRLSCLIKTSVYEAFLA